MSKESSSATSKPKRTIKRVSPQKKSIVSAEEIELRTIKKPVYRSFRLAKRIKHPKPQILGSFRLFKKTFGSLWKMKRVVIPIIILYLFFLLVFVKGFNSTSVGLDLSELTDQLLNADTGKVLSGLTVFSVLVGSSSSQESEVAGIIRSILLLMFSLAIIWTVRQSFAGLKIRVRDAFYRGMYPMVPFLLVLFVVAIQMIPIVIATFLYNVVFVAGLASAGLEQILWALLFSLLIIWSLYMVSSSLMALYIVTLPDMTPMKALRSARGLVRFRRWTVMRRALFLPLALLFVLLVFLAPFVFFLPEAAEWVFFVLSSSFIFVIHTYYYSLYRELIK